MIPVEDQCIRDATILCTCWVRLANGTYCPLATPSHRVINATPVASFQCPRCELVMMRNADNTYQCITKECDASGVKYKPVAWEMERVDG